MQEPDITAWLAEAKTSPEASFIGMYLTHNGIVRATPRAEVRPEEHQVDDGMHECKPVIAVDFSYDHEGLERACEESRSWEGVYYVRAWLAEGRVEVGGSLMYVLIGADIRPHAISALEKLVGIIKSTLVSEREIYE